MYRSLRSVHLFLHSSPFYLTPLKSYALRCLSIGQTTPNNAPCRGGICAPTWHMVPQTYPTQHPKRDLDWFRCFYTAHGRVITAYNGQPLSSLKIAPSHWGPNLIHGSLGSPESKTQTALRSSQPFLQGSQSWNTDGPTDWQTDHATLSGATGCIYIHSTAMQANNNKHKRSEVHKVTNHNMIGASGINKVAALGGVDMIM